MSVLGSCQADRVKTDSSEPSRISATYQQNVPGTHATDTTTLKVGAAPRLDGPVAVTQEYVIVVGEWSIRGLRCEDHVTRPKSSFGSDVVQR